MTSADIQKHLDAIQHTIPEGNKGVIVMYGDRNEVHFTIATKVGKGWEMDFGSDLVINEYNKPDVDFFFGVKKYW